MAGDVRLADQEVGPARGVQEAALAQHEEAPQVEDMVAAPDLPLVNLEHEAAGMVARDGDHLSVRQEEVGDVVDAGVLEGLEGAVILVHDHDLHLQEVPPEDRALEGVRQVILEGDEGDRPTVTEIGGEEGDHTAVQEAGARVRVALVPQCREVAVGAEEALDPDLIVARDQEQGVGLIVDRDHTPLDHVRFQQAQAEAGEEALFPNGEMGARTAKEAAKVEVTFETVNLAAKAGAILRQASEFPSDIALAKLPRSVLLRPLDRYGIKKITYLTSLYYNESSVVERVSICDERPEKKSSVPYSRGRHLE
jgi:hypothetical protein